MSNGETKIILIMTTKTVKYYLTESHRHFGSQGKPERNIQEK